MKKINNKGFTLIELLATIVLLGILSTVTIVTITTFFERSKEKTEEAFTKQLEGYVEDYIALYGGSLSGWNSIGTYYKCYQDGASEKCDMVSLNETSSNKNLKEIIDEFANQDVYNPKTKVQCTNDNTTLTIYRDSDFVYCFTIKPNGNSCLVETISTCENRYKSDICAKALDDEGNETEYCTFK